VRAGIVDRALGVDYALARVEMTGNGRGGVEAAIALQGVNPGIIAWKAVRQHLPAMRAWNVFHATITGICRLQRQPEADFPILQTRVLKRLVLMPGCRRADAGGLEQRDIGLEPDFIAQNLAGDRRG